MLISKTIPVNRDSPALADRRPESGEVEVHDLLARRWSPRAFTDQEVAPGVLTGMFEAARWAPSSFNKQPWSFIVALRRREPDFSRMLSLLTERNRLWAASAPVLILAIGTLRDPADASQNGTALYDLGHAVGNLTVQAVSHGLQVHQMGGFDREKARELFSIPAGLEPMTVIAVGYPGEEQGLRPRKPLAAFVFEEKWGKPATHNIGIISKEQ